MRQSHSVACLCNAHVGWHVRAFGGNRPCERVPPLLLLCPVLQGVCPTIRFHQYIIASTICVSHHRALSVFFGNSLPTLAELFSGKPVSNIGVAVYRFVSASPRSCRTALHSLGSNRFKRPAHMAFCSAQ
jgi:hypothetical protein